MSSHPGPSRPVKSRQSGPSGNAEYSRKDKSLGLLCENFVQEFGRVENQRISLDAAANTLGVERRRIYDIVNVLESVGIVSRQAKNCYAWRGFTQIHSKLEDLKQKASSDLFGGPEDFRTSSQFNNQGNKATPNENGNPSSGNGSNIRVNGEVHINNTVQTTIPRPTSRKEKSLGVLSQRFVQLFLLAGSNAVSLENAAIQLLGRSPTDSDPVGGNPLEGADATKLLKTKVRRLYDIANILTSLNLIEKVHTANRKPAFKWLGPEASCNAIRALRDNENNKRLHSAASLDDRARGSIKRRRTFSGGSYGSGEMFGANSNNNRGGNNRDEDDEIGFDPVTKRKIDSVIRTFPETYAKRWRDYVASVNDMMIRGQVSREKAYESVANVLKQYRGDEDDDQEDDDAEEHVDTRSEFGPVYSKYDKKRGRDFEDSERERQIERLQRERERSKRDRERERDRDFDRDGEHPRSTAGGNGRGYLSNGNSRGGDSNYDHLGRGGGSVGSMSSGGEDQLNGSSGAFRVKKEAMLDDGNEQRNGGMKPEDKFNRNSREDKVDDDDSKNKERSRYSGGSKEDEQKMGSRTFCNDVDETGNGEDKKTGEGNSSGATGTGDSEAIPKGMTWTQESIDLYMRRAKAAGPEYEKAAKQWLQDLRNWQKLWAGSIAAIALPQNITAAAAAAAAVTGVANSNSATVADNSRSHQANAHVMPQMTNTTTSTIASDASNPPSSQVAVQQQQSQPQVQQPQPQLQQQQHQPQSHPQVQQHQPQQQPQQQQIQQMQQHQSVQQVQQPLQQQQVNPQQLQQQQAPVPQAAIQQQQVHPQQVGIVSQGSTQALGAGNAVGTSGPIRPVPVLTPVSVPVTTTSSSTSIPIQATSNVPAHATTATMNPNMGGTTQVNRPSASMPMPNSHSSAYAGRMVVPMASSNSMSTVGPARHGHATIPMSGHNSMAPVGMQSMQQHHGAQTSAPANTSAINGMHAPQTQVTAPGQGTTTVSSAPMSSIRSAPTQGNVLIPGGHVANPMAISTSNPRNNVPTEAMKKANTASGTNVTPATREENNVNVMVASEGNSNVDEHLDSQSNEQMGIENDMSGNQTSGENDVLSNGIGGQHLGSNADSLTERARAHDTEMSEASMFHVNATRAVTDVELESQLHKQQQTQLQSHLPPPPPPPPPSKAQLTKTSTPLQSQPSKDIVTGTINDRLGDV